MPFFGKRQNKKLARNGASNSILTTSFFRVKLPNVAFFYDPMHGLSRLLTYCLQQLLEYLRIVSLEKQTRTLEILVLEYTYNFGGKLQGHEIYFHESSLGDN